MAMNGSLEEEFQRFHQENKVTAVLSTLTIYTMIQTYFLAALGPMLMLVLRNPIHRDTQSRNQCCMP